MANQVIVTEGDVVAEDLYALGGRTIVEGTVQGDLIVLSGEVIVTGTVEGDVVGLVWGPARFTGEVGESVLLARAAPGCGRAGRRRRECPGRGGPGVGRGGPGPGGHRGGDRL